MYEHWTTAHNIFPDDIFMLPNFRTRVIKYSLSGKGNFALFSLRFFFKIDCSTTWKKHYMYMLNYPEVHSTFFILKKVFSSIYFIKEERKKVAYFFSYSVFLLASLRYEEQVKICLYFSYLRLKLQVSFFPDICTTHKAKTVWFFWGEMEKCFLWFRLHIRLFGSIPGLSDNL